jgi:tyrosinase
MSHFVITGVQGAGAPNRLEINDFVKNDKFFSLFVQALTTMQKDNQADVPSFFSVGKVHGLPYKTWDGAVGSHPWNPNTTWGGYCTHGSVLFPTWHRPYMILYEQIIQSYAKQIAATYSVDRNDWVQAANELRHPFWDWASNSVPPDEVVALPQVQITGPAGTKITVDNPLYQYTFHPIDPSFPNPYSLWQTTLRQPTTEDESAQDDVDQLKAVLGSAQSDITSSTYNMLTRVTDWPGFSNHTPGDGGSTSNSLEAIHDGIHVDVGGAGQMGDPAVAAYDPIFYLHHCNVDRMLQLWSALHPDVWVSSNSAETGTYTIPANTKVDENTPLTPFWKTQSTFWESSATRSTSPLGYTYPDFNGLDTNDPSAVQAAIANIVNQLYGSSVFGVQAFARPAAGAVSAPKKPAAPAPAAAPAAPAAPPPPPAAVPAPAVPHAAPAQHVLAPPSAYAPPQVPIPAPKPLYDWTCRVHFKKYELGASCAVLIFLGDVPEEPSKWRTCPNYVGAHYGFVNSKAEKCDNCRSQADLVVEGFVHLDSAIISKHGPDLSPEHVKPYLKHHLKWRVQKANGEAANLSSLEVSVYETPISYPPGATLPVYGKRTHHTEITHGREGGSRHHHH